MAQKYTLLKKYHPKQKPEWRETDMKASSNPSVVSPIYSESEAMRFLTDTTHHFGKKDGAESLMPPSITHDRFQF